MVIRVLVHTSASGYEKNPENRKIIKGKRILLIQY
jgi:hypothetical protein